MDCAEAASFILVVSEIWIKLFQFYGVCLNFRYKLWANHILFRDYLREHFETVIEYAYLKTDLAIKYPNDRDSYTAGKDEFIKSIIEKVRKEIIL